MAFPLQDATLFPPIPAVRAGLTVRLKGADFARVVEEVAYAICPDEKRSGLTGAHLEVGEDWLALVATDGSRLARSHLAGRQYTLELPPGPGLADRGTRPLAQWRWDSANSARRCG